MLKNIFRYIAILPALLFLFGGINWLIDADAAAQGMGIPVIEGMARSSLIGDVGSFFFAGGCIIVLGILTLQRTWFYSAALLLGVAAIFRVVGWLVQGAPFVTSAIIIEVVLAVLMLLCAQFACTDNSEPAKQ